MKTITIETPLVSECSVTECAYNLNSDCHARAITIGDGVHPGLRYILRQQESHQSCHAHRRDWRLQG